MPRKLFTRAFLNSLGVVVYVAIVATVMQNANQFFGTKDTALSVTGFLLLLCVSAATVASLVFGYPVMLFLNGQKREAVQALMMTVGCLAGEMVLVLLTVALMQ